MSYVSRAVDELRNNGFYSATRVERGAISKIINMEEWEYYGLEISIIESYLGLLAQQVYYIQQECNIAEAKEIELGNDFKINALPFVIDLKIRSVEERWLFASSLTDDLRIKFDLWQRSIIDATLKNDLADPVVEKLNVLKKIYDDRRMEGRNRNLHKYVDGNPAGE
jgi:hypothetical protein